MAATHGRLTGRPGVCISTLGPGALNFSTAAAYAHLGAMPMIMITGQKAIMTARQARFQIVDVIASMKPLTKMTRQIVSAASIPTIVREAFRVAQEERPGPVHLELPEDVAARRDARESPARAAAPGRHPGGACGGARPRRRDDRQGEAPPDHARRGSEPAALDGRARRLRAAHPDSVLHDADGQGHGRRRLEALHRHHRPLRARLRPRGDRQGRPHHRDRARHDREAALHHGSRRGRR